MSIKSDAAAHWLHYAAGWRSFPRPTVVTLWDACRYATRDGYVVTYQPPYNRGQGSIIIATPIVEAKAEKPAPRIFYMVRAMGSVGKLLEAVDAWAKGVQS